MSRHLDLVVLSPHLDDGVLSCGARLAATTESDGSAAVVTVFAGDPPPDVLNPLATELRRVWGLPDGEVLARRRAEDEEACRRLGAEAIHWNLPEALYRGGADGAPHYRDVRSLYGELAAGEETLVDELAARLDADLPEAGLLLAPLAVGGHVDHRLLRAAAERATREVAFYEDFPYVEWKWNALSRALGRWKDWEEEVLELTPELLERRAEAIEAYASQLPALFRTPARLRKQLRRAARRARGERIWRRSTAPEGAR